MSNAPPHDAWSQFSHHAMACEWGIILPGCAPTYAEQCARAAWDEVDRLERELSRFVPHSDISRINRLAPGESLRIGPDAFECIDLARRMHDLTGGMFDITIGSRVNTASRGGRAVPATLADSDAAIGMHHLLLDPSSRSVRVAQHGITVDLGAIGKGFAVDAVARLLREWSIEAAMIHSGQSTALALGAPPGVDAWRVMIRNPLRHAQVLAAVDLRDASLSGSGTLLHGTHIIDPATGRPAAGPLAAWALTASAAESDAISTAMMVLDEPRITELSRRRPDVVMWFVPRDPVASPCRLFRVAAGAVVLICEFDGSDNIH